MTSGRSDRRSPRGLATVHVHNQRTLPHEVLLFIEDNANPLFVPPYDATWVLIAIAPDYQNKFIRNTEWAGHIETDPVGR